MGGFNSIVQVRQTLAYLLARKNAIPTQFIRGYTYATTSRPRPSYIVAI